jgi:hypothetical protein
MAIFIWNGDFYSNDLNFNFKVTSWFDCWNQRGMYKHWFPPETGSQDLSVGIKIPPKLERGFEKYLRVRRPLSDQHILFLAQSYLREERKTLYQSTANTLTINLARTMLALRYVRWNERVSRSPEARCWRRKHGIPIEVLGLGNLGRNPVLTCTSSTSSTNVTVLSFDRFHADIPVNISLMKI